MAQTTNRTNKTDVGEVTPRPRVIFSADDAHFLTWVLGFTAGANLERDGERGERIFARCRALEAKLDPVGVAGGNAS